MIAIVDYGMGNLGSIKNMLSRIGAEAEITADHELIGAADKLILPGVGAFDKAMRKLDELDLISLLNRRVIDDGVPLLGICLGMHLLTRGSEEGDLAGLGWIDATTRHFESCELSGPLRVPHMGWNVLRPRHANGILAGLEDDSRFYFVHSYFVDCAEDGNVLATTEYGEVEFASVIGSGRIVGTQFHPEKSHRHGMGVLRRFSTW